MQVAKAAQTALSGKASNPNLLDNWYFADPINQRGQTEYTGAVYTIDRWKIESPGASAIIEDYGVVFINNQDSSNTLQQIFENYVLMPGNTYTISGLIDSVTGTGGYLILQEAESPYSRFGEVRFTSHGLFSINAVVPNGYTGLFKFGAFMDANTTLKIIASKLELGDHQTLAHQDVDGNWVLNDPPPNKALELLKCQRDQMVYKNQDCVGIAIGNTILIQKPCMRANPTVLQNGATLDIASYTVGLNELTLQSVTANNAFIVAKVQNMNFDCTPVFVKYDSPAPLILDANL